MKVVKLEDGKFALTIPLQEPYIRIKKYEPYGEEVDKATITTLTEDMYVEWELRYYNNAKKSSPIYETKGRLPYFEQAVCDCFKYEIYTEQDVSDYQRFIEQQNDYGDIESIKIYYDSRAIIDGMDKDFTSSVLKEYDINNPQEIPQKNKKFPFWIEVHSKQPYICFHGCIIVLKEKQYLILDSGNKYALLEACRVFAALKDIVFPLSDNGYTYIRNLFEMCLDSVKIAKAFELMPDEYNIYTPISPLSPTKDYSIYPIDRNNGKVIIKKFPENIDILNEYALTFERCIFMLEKENNKVSLRIERELNAPFIDKAIKFDTCIFKVDVYIHHVFNKEISFKNSTFECPVEFLETEFENGIDLTDVTFKGTVSFRKTHFGNSDSSKIYENKIINQSMKIQNNFLRTIFENDVNFQSTHFHVSAFFSDAKFKKGADFFNSTFKQQAKFSGATFDDYTTFNSAKFLSEANFMDAHFKNGTYFTSSVFEQYAWFSGVTFHGDANFDHAEFQTKENSQGIADFSGAHFKERVFFTKAHFHQKASLSNVIFDHNAYFDDVNFLGEVNFSLSEFNETANFENANFLGKTIFVGTQFKKDSLFLNAAFSETEFNQSKFYQIAYFYGTKFNKTPNFIQVIFNGNVNFTNTELGFGFDEVKEKMEEIYNAKEKAYNDTHDKKEREEPKKYKIANEFRDSFRNIKSALIKDNNMLDASNYHKIELYCKELELEHKENSTIRDFIDRIQLIFYRLTSDHHTDLLLILNNVIILIACFGAMNFILNLICNRNYFDLSNSKVAIALGTLVACIIFIILALCLILGCYRNILHSFKLKMNNIQLFLSQIFFTTKQNTKICPRACIVLFSYIITTITLVTKPTLLLPIFGQMIDSKSNLGFAFMSLNIVYAILMFLLIFSLQKTARKNTIVPS